LTVGREPFEGLMLPHGLVALDQAADLRRQHEKAAIDPAAVTGRFLEEADDLVFRERQRAEATRRLGAGHRRVPPRSAVKLDRRANVDVANAVTVSQAE